MAAKQKKYPFLEYVIVGLLIGFVLLLVLTHYGVISRPALSLPTSFPNVSNTTEHLVISISTSTDDFVDLPIPLRLFEYIQVTDSCGPHYGDECLNIRSAPTTTAPVVTQVRNGMVLKVDHAIEVAGETWYKVIFDEWLRYPERLRGEWFVAGAYVESLLNEGDRTTWEDGETEADKRIIVDRSEQKIYAYEGESLFMETDVSTGLELTPTPRGTFTIFKKTPSRYMQGPLPGISSDHYDLPGVPWNLYFTEQGAVIHGAYWHDSFGKQYSHGCVNLKPHEAKELYDWAELGTKVIVRD